MLDFLYPGLILLVVDELSDEEMFPLLFITKNIRNIILDGRKRKSIIQMDFIDGLLTCGMEQSSLGG